MSAMIQDLVEMVLLESGQLRLAHVRIELPAYLADLVHGLRGALPTARIQLSAQEGVPAVEVDPPRLERIVVNLLSNALKYSPPASPVVVEVLAEAAGEVVIRVADGGIGIAPEDQGRIFGRFYRVTGSRQPEGLGLGLYIARLLTEAHGGRITLESAPGRGSVFSVHLPVAR
jgi:signal transduction histidine kinase